MNQIACPSCGAPTGPAAWFCAVCGEQLASEGAILDRRPPAGEASVLGPIIGTSGERSDELTQSGANTGGGSSGPSRWDSGSLGAMTIADITDTVAWEPDPAMFLQSEALILGDLQADQDADSTSETYEGVVGTGDGGAESFVIYTNAQVSKDLSPGTVLRRVEGSEDRGLTPYEDHLLEEIDGHKTISQIENSSILSSYEVSVSLLTLLDRGLVEPVPLPPASVFPKPPPPPEASLSLAIDVDEARVPPPRHASFSPSVPVSIVRNAPLEHERLPVRRRRTLGPGAEGQNQKALLREGRKMEKAERLFELALRDQAEGNLISARMNLKLALAFSPDDERFQGLFAQLTQTKVPPKNRTLLRHPQAQAYFEAATKAEMAGEINRTVELLERALKHGEEAAVLNRLGVILAMKKKEFARAQRLLERASELDPKNPAYLHNLSKVLGLHATAQERGRDSAPAKPTPGRLWQWLKKLRSSS